MSDQIPHGRSDGGLTERLRRDAGVLLVSPREAAQERFRALQPIAEEYNRLVTALLILAEGESEERQAALWARYVASRTRTHQVRIVQGSDTSDDDPTPTSDAAFESLLALLDPNRAADG